MAEGGSYHSRDAHFVIIQGISESDDADGLMCDPCSIASKRYDALKFCIDCQENLCESCTDAHRKSKPSRNHKLADITESSISSKHELKQLGDTTCEKHRDKEVEMFCFTHNVYCCLLCATVNHKECAGLVEIPTLATTARNKMARLDAMYKTARTHVGTLKSLCEKEKKEIPKKAFHLEGTLVQVRDQIVTEIDAFIKDQIDQVKNEASLCDAELDAILLTLDEIVSSCQKSEDSMTTAREYGLPIHIVTTQKQATDGCMKIEKEIENVEKRMTKFEIDCPVIIRLETLRQDLINSRSEKVQTVEEKLEFVCYEDSLRPNARKDMKKVDEYEIRPVSGRIPIYTGITTLGVNKVLLCDNYGGDDARGHICMYNTETKSLSELKLNKPFGVVVMKSQPTEVAVTLPGDNEIKILSYRDKSFGALRTYRTEKKPYSIVPLENGLFGVTFDYPPSFDIVDIRGKEMKTLKTYTQDTTGRQFKSFKYVAVDELRSHIIQPCDKENKVFCFDFSGQSVFTYEDTGLKTPTGVCLDVDGSIYIGSQEGMHVLTPVGRKVKSVTEGIPNWILDICFDDTGARVFLSNDTLSQFELK